MMSRLTVAALLVLLALPSLAAAASERIDLEQRGTLREVIRALAEKAELNVIVIGSVEQPAEVYLHGVTGEEALQTLAKLHGLTLEREGKTWVVRAPENVTAPMPSAGGNFPTNEEGAPSRVPGTPAVAAPGLPLPPPDPVGPPHPARPQPVGRASDRVASGRLHIQQGETVASAVSFGGPLIVDGHVERDVVAIGGVVKLGPTAVVDGNVVAVGARVEKAPGARVGRDEVAMGLHGLHVRQSTSFDDEDADADAMQLGASAGQDGEEAEAEFAAEEASEDEVNDRHESSDLAWFLVRFLVLFGLGALGFLAFPGRMRHLENELRASPVASIFVGLLGLLAALPLTFLLCVTLIGIPVAIALWAVLVAFWLFGLTTIARIIGSRLPKVKTSRSEALLLAGGLVVLLIAFSIPVLKWILIPLGACIGVGAGLLATIRGRPRALPEPIGGASAPI